jgi:hypothetical protein
LRSFGICELSTLNASFEEDLAAYAAAGGPQQALVEQWRRFVNR